MDTKRLSMAVVGAGILCVVFIMAVSYVATGSIASWGKLQVTPIHSVTVTGEAKTQQKTQVAVFAAGVNSYNDDKNAAVAEVNSKVTAVIDAVKGFGIPAEDIKTQSMNIYQQQDTYFEDGRQKFRPGQWNVSNTIEMKLRNVDRAAELTAVLTKTGANNVYGPNFAFDDTGEAATALFDAALENASQKAQKVAAVSGRKLGEVINVTEGTVSQPMVYKMEGAGGGGGGGPIEPGTGTVTKTVTVTYELQ